MGSPRAVNIRRSRRRIISCRIGIRMYTEEVPVSRVSYNHAAPIRVDLTPVRKRKEYIMTRRAQTIRRWSPCKKAEWLYCTCGIRLIQGVWYKKNGTVIKDIYVFLGRKEAFKGPRDIHQTVECFEVLYKDFIGEGSLKWTNDLKQ